MGDYSIFSSQKLIWCVDQFYAEMFQSSKLKVWFPFQPDIVEIFENSLWIYLDFSPCLHAAGKMWEKWFELISNGWERLSFSSDPFLRLFLLSKLRAAKVIWIDIGWMGRLYLGGGVERPHKGSQWSHKRISQRNLRKGSPTGSQGHKRDQNDLRKDLTGPLRKIPPRSADNEISNLPHQKSFSALSKKSG